MPSSEALTDEYLAQLLAKDAQDRTIKYSSYGLQTGLPKRPTSNAPKPNTRFLKNIIKETDNHNAALKAKEVADARARLRSINGHEARSGQQRRDEIRPRVPDSRSSKRRKLSKDEDDGGFAETGGTRRTMNNGEILPMTTPSNSKPAIRAYIVDTIAEGGIPKVFHQMQIEEDIRDQDTDLEKNPPPVPPPSPPTSLVIALALTLSTSTKIP
ncbi:MAG: hypothetical protein Q9218_001862 [Villophora microphyllina]